MPKQRQFTQEQIAFAEAYVAGTPPENIDPRVESLVNELIGRVADKWTMLVLEVLAGIKALNPGGAGAKPLRHSLSPL
jgi:hypothetical protein